MGQEWEQSGNKEHQSGTRMGTKWEQEPESGNTVGTKRKRGPQSGGKWEQEPQSGARMGTKGNNVGTRTRKRDKNPKPAQEWEQSGKKVGTRTPIKKSKPSVHGVFLAFTFQLMHVAWNPSQESVRPATIGWETECSPRWKPHVVIDVHWLFEILKNHLFSWTLSYQSQ